MVGSPHKTPTRNGPTTVSSSLLCYTCSTTLRSRRADRCGKREPFLYSKRSSYQDKLGTTQEKAQEKGIVSSQDYLERAVAALRSTFAIAPYENWAHTGGSQGDVQGALSSAMHWGEGSAAASVLFTREQLGDLFVFAGRNPHGVCVNGCSMTNLTVQTGADGKKRLLLCTIPSLLYRLSRIGQKRAEKHT